MRKALLPFSKPKKELSIIFSRELPQYLTLPEVQAVLKVAEKPRDHLMINLLWQTGCRISELLEIRVEDIDFYGKTLRIRSLKQKVKKGSWRIVPLKGEILGELGGYISQEGLKKGKRLFSITRQRAYQIVLFYCKKARIDRQRSHPHIFRHSFAINCILSGVPVLVLKSWLGHRDINDTLIYTQILARDTKEFINQVNF